MGTAIDYKKQMIETVFIKLPGPVESTPGMTGGELLHGFLAELYETQNPELKAFVSHWCNEWNIHYVESGG